MPSEMLPAFFSWKTLLLTFHKTNISLPRSYFTKMKNLWDELASYHSFIPFSCGALNNLTDYQHQEQLLQFLIGLNKTFTTVRSQILLMDPLPFINKACALLIQEEKQRELHVVAPIVETTAFITTTHETTDTNRAITHLNQQCSYCHKPGHTKEHYYKLIGYPQRQSKSKNPKIQQQSSCPSSGAISTSQPCTQLTTE